MRAYRRFCYLSLILGFSLECHAQSGLSSIEQRAARIYQHQRKIEYQEELKRYEEEELDRLKKQQEEEERLHPKVKVKKVKKKPRKKKKDSIDKQLKKYKKKKTKSHMILVSAS